MRIAVSFLAPVLALGLALGLAITAPANAAEPSWPDLKDSLYGDQLLTVAPQIVQINVPYRTTDDARTQISASINPPAGRKLKSVSVILDENPMPVSAVFNFDQPVPRFFFDVTMRVNGPTPIHVVAKAENGQLFVADGFIKTSGQGACSAPPGTDTQEALATLGEMNISISRHKQNASLIDQLGSLGTGDKQVDVSISHPSLSGMQMDQITLLFIPMRYVEKIDVGLDGRGFVDVTGSISLSENPEVSISVPGATRSVDVMMTDTDGTVTRAKRSLAEY